MNIPRHDNLFRESFDIFLRERIEKIATGVQLESIKKSVDIIPETNTAIFTFHPLPKGAGTSIGNALRRQLLSHIDGYAFVALKVNDAPHMFSSLPGVREDVSDIVMSLKNVGIKCHLENVEGKSWEFSLMAEKEGEVYAGDFFCPEGFSISTPNQFICYLDGSHKLNMHLLVAKGSGYVPFQEYEKTEGEGVPYSQGDNYILMDTFFNPVKRVNFKVLPAYHASKIDFDLLEMEIETNGSINPERAMQQAVSGLLKSIALLSDDKDLLNTRRKGDKSHKALPFNKLCFEKIEVLNLPARAYRGLINMDVGRGDSRDRKGVSYIISLLLRTEQELLNINSIGRKSVTSIKEALKARNLALGEIILKGFPAKEIDIELAIDSLKLLGLPSREIEIIVSILERYIKENL